MTPWYRRCLALVVSALFLLLAACGGGEDETAKGFDAVKITGAAGEEPKVKWTADMEPGQKKVEVLHEGDGRAVKAKDKVAIDYLLSNGVTHQTSPNSFDTEGAGFVMTVGATVQPTVAQDLLVELISAEVKPGTKVGTRMAIAVGAEQAFGKYANALGSLKIGNKDGLLIIFEVLDAPKKGWSAAKVSGAVGEKPEIEWNGVMDAGKQQSKTITKGTGSALKAGDPVMINYILANGVTHKTAIDTYGSKATGAGVTLGQAASQPSQPSDAVTGLLATAVKAGTKVGTRGAIAAEASTAFGQNAGILGGVGVGSTDSVVIVYDVVGVPMDAPKGKKVEPAAWAPKIVEKKGDPASLDFKGITKPAIDEDLGVTTVIEGTGPKVEEGDVVFTSYLGQVHGGKKPFDASYTRGEPFPFGAIEGGGVIEGWIEGVQGVPVGSRIILRVPPELGYGPEGQEPSIKGTDTLYFVIDVLGAA